MKFSVKNIMGIAAVAALGAVSLFAEATTAPQHHWRHGLLGPRMSAALNLTDAQKAQEKIIFQQARQTTQPIRQQLRATRQSLRAAVKADSMGQIQQLSKTEGTELGQLKAVRSSAFANFYKALTPEQQQKLTAMQQARHSHRRAPASQASGA